MDPKDKDSENAALLEDLENREVGTKELFEFYSGVEAIYANSIQALEAIQFSKVSTSANNE